MSENIDTELLKDLVEIMGDDMKLLINSYLNDTKIKLDELENLDVAAQQNQIYRIAHSLKGSSRNVGAMLFADHCESIENMARSETLSQDDFSIEQLRSLFGAAETELTHLFLD